MDSLKEVSRFFHEISPKILYFVAQSFKNSHIIKRKGHDYDIDFVTEADVEIENIIVGEIKNRFPKDQIIAEENFSDTKPIDKGRLWIVDPICGTSNFAKKIKLFATNIALAIDGKLVASCVMDHSQNVYIWSIGENSIFINQNKVGTDKVALGVKVEVDLSGLHQSTKEVKEIYSGFIRRLISETKYSPITYATSLGFAYVSLGRIDVYMNPNIRLWDMAAANFLTLQAGGIVTDIQGLPWTLNSSSVLAAKDKRIHKELLNLFIAS
jgi:myo-inositol-1(or 4)-monophosphatase